MASIRVTSDTWPNIVVAYLFDKMLHPEDVSKGNEEFTELTQKMKQLGLIAKVRDYYLRMDTHDRVKYKLIKDIFEGLTTADSRVIIGSVPEEEEKKPGILKRALKALISSNEFSEEDINLLKEELFLEEDNNG